MSAVTYILIFSLERPIPCAVTSQHACRHTCHRNDICAPRYYSVTRLLQQESQSSPQPHERDTIGSGGDAPRILGREGKRIFRPAESIREEIANTQETAREQLEPSELELQQEKLKNSVRGLMRNVPSSVAVLTVESIDPDTRQHVPMGVAVSSLSTVTLDPPTVSFNIKEPSKTLDAIRAADGLFRVHFPSADKGGAKVVDLFCRGNHPDAYSLRLKELNVYQPKLERPRLHYNPTDMPSLAPQLLGEHVLAAMECRVTHEFPIADHVILVAKINNVEQKASKDPTIMYVNGEYRNPRGERLHTPIRPTQSAANKWLFSVWDYPLFPGEIERRDYMEKIKAFVKENPAYYENPSRETYRIINSSLPYAPGSLGISIEPLVAECRQEMGLPVQLRAEVVGQQVLSDFYGPLTPAMRAQIVDRAKRLVALDDRFLTQHYWTLLYNLGVNPSSRDFLPSDIMKPLRAADLAPPFDPRRGHVNSPTQDIFKVEQYEYHLRNHFRRLKFDAALRIPLEEAMEAIGERKTTAIHFRKARARLLAESHPTRFDASVVDISGEVTQEEIRVVICRLINALQVASEVGLRKNISRDWRELLRRVGVNPTITGMDAEFLMGKIQHLYYSSRLLWDFLRAVEEMLRPWFKQNVSWEELEERVKSFVQKIPIRATGWSGKDRLAAMGLHWDATVTLPSNNLSKQEDEKPLNRGVILDTLVARELKRYYGSGTEEENQAIARYLEETYSFDVTQRPTPYKPAASPSQSSGDEMQQAMRASLEATEEEAQFEQATSGQSPYSQGSTGPSQTEIGSPKVWRMKVPQSVEMAETRSGPRPKHVGTQKQRKHGQGAAEDHWDTFSFIEGRNP
jgi:flavin reductase (DIM6/NTAB) family NADH-FMN oxidoreductase RutF